MRIRLFDYWRSSASYRVRIALAVKGVAYERVAVSLVDGEQLAKDHRARNPQGFVPTLEVDGVALGQSLAIVDWLDAVVPEPRLTPQEPIARARALQATMLIAADIHPINNLRVLKRLKAEHGLSDDAQGDWVRHWVREGFEALERMVATSAGRFLGGDAPESPTSSWCRRCTMRGASRSTSRRSRPCCAWMQRAKRIPPFRRRIPIG